MKKNNFIYLILVIFSPLFHLLKFTCQPIISVDKSYLIVHIKQKKKNYPTNQYLAILVKDKTESKCTFCNSHSETVFWKDFVQIKVYEDITINWEYVL